MFGGYAPFPMRLQPGDLDNISPEQWLRLCADLAAAKRALPFAVVLVTVTPGGTGTTAVITAYTGRNGAGLDACLFAATAGTGVMALSLLANAWTDEAGQAHSLTLAHVDASLVGLAGRVTWTTSTRGASLYLDTVATAPFSILVTVYDRESAQADPADYGGDRGKVACLTESAKAPLAAELMEQIQGARGSSYTLTPGTLVDLENLALARGLAYLRRKAEQALVQRDPSRAGQALPYWVSLLGADPTMPASTQREHLGALWVASMRGPGAIVTDQAITATLRESLGALFLQTHRAPDVITNGQWAPVAPEWWSMVAEVPPWYWNPMVGHWASGLGIGMADAVVGPWTSSRLHLAIEVQRSATLSEDAWRARMDAVDGSLSTSMPVWCTWDWCTDFDTGFYLDASDLDSTGIN